MENLHHRQVTTRIRRGPQAQTYTKQHIKIINKVRNLKEAVKLTKQKKTRTTNSPLDLPEAALVAEKQIPNKKTTPEERRTTELTEPRRDPSFEHPANTGFAHKRRQEAVTKGENTHQQTNNRSNTDLGSGGQRRQKNKPADGGCSGGTRRFKGRRGKREARRHSFITALQS